MKVIDSIVTEAARMAAIRREIHAYPELCFEEVRTSELVAKKLNEWGIPVQRGLGRTGRRSASHCTGSTGIFSNS